MRPVLLFCLCSSGGQSGWLERSTNQRKVGEARAAFLTANWDHAGASGYHHRLAGAAVLPLLPTGGEGWGEEATFIECPSPHSCLAGRGRKSLVVVSRCTRTTPGAECRFDNTRLFAHFATHTIRKTSSNNYYEKNPYLHYGLCVP